MVMCGGSTTTTNTVKTVQPTSTPRPTSTPKPTATPTVKPTSTPTKKPTLVPTKIPTPTNITIPTNNPTPIITNTPTLEPTKREEISPTIQPQILGVLNSVSYYGYFETVITSIVVLIYLNLTYFISSWSNFQSHATIDLYKEFKKTRSLLHIDEDEEYDDEEIEKVEDTLKTNQTKFYIDAIFTWINCVITIFYLITNL